MVVPVDLTPFYEARVVRYCQLAPAALVVYEYFLQFRNEVDLFWRKKSSVTKVLFIWSRYYTLAFNATVAYCERFFSYQEIGLGLQVLTTHAILELRLYAMYERSKWVLAFFGFLTVGETITMGILIGWPKDGVVVTNEPFPGLFICADADPDHSPWIAYNWTLLLGVEFILLCMSLYKARVYHRSGGYIGLVQRLTKDSVWYFFIMFWIYLANQVIWLVNKVILTELATGFFFGVCAVLSHRILISVRAEHFENELEFYHDTPSLRFEHHRATRDELQTFAILTGHEDDDDR
ncbi:hypothetical protein ONZ45_g8913 [Pleurotus djamor]|nr:hypothetical protein ONZ45_g8913 [Pleurotus djamor]